MEDGNKNRVCKGDWVVLNSSDGKKILGNLSSDSTARIGKKKRKLAGLIGHYWGQNFVVQANDTLAPVADVVADFAQDEFDMTCQKDNRHLIDSNSNQTLAHETITRLKESGVHGEQLVRTVANHSSTFKDKTAFSQDKYLARKRAKFDLRVRLIKPTASSLCDMYFSKSPEKTMNLRVDALGILLAYSGVQSGARVIVYENCTGLVTGAVAERLGGAGVLLNVFTGPNPPGTELLRMLNLSPDCMRAIVHTPIQIFDVVNVDESIDSVPIKYNPNAELQSDNEEHVYLPNPARAEAIAMRVKRGAVKQWLRSGCDCLVVATRYDVVKIFDTLLKYVAPSGTFSAYCTHLQDAADLQYALQLSRMAIRVELWESSLVHHQVLPGRTHPEMSDSATGGYVVTGVRIETAPNMAT